VHSTQVYRLSPSYLKDEQRCRLAYSIKKLIESLPLDEYRVCAHQAEALFLRLLGNGDACDFVLHHHLVLALLVDEFDRVQCILGLLASRCPRIGHQVLDFSEDHLGDDFAWYEAAYALNDLPQGSLRLVSPGREAAGRSRQWIARSLEVLRLSAPEVFAEFEAFGPLLILASASREGALGFGGYSSMIAWGAIALNAEIDGLIPILIQIVHEQAHQLLFALSAEIPLVYNHPQELYASPLRRDPRPMDGVIHACFVSARVHEVLQQVQAGPSFTALASSDQEGMAAALSDTAAAVTAALPTIEQSARLSAIGERVVDAARRAVGNS
jgi:hypothetical protein